MIPISEPNIGEKERAYVLDAVQSGWVSSLGYYVEKFENDFARYCDVRYGASTSNGTVALHLALAALKIGPGDEVLLPDFTFAATANAVLYTGAVPVFVDSEHDTWNIDARLIEARITNRTKAIIPVHIYGHPCDMDPILALAKKYKLFVIEDAAEAHGAEYKGRKVGNFSDIACFSFYGNKTVTTGEGGICITNDTVLNDRLRLLRDHGMRKSKRYWHDEIGFNYRLTNLQAALGCAQMERIDDFIATKRKNALKYNQLLKGLGWISLPPEKEYAKSTYWMYSVLITEKAPFDRDTVISRLRDSGIDSRNFFYPVTAMPPYEKYRGNASFPVSQRISASGINLPSSTKLTTEEIDFICATLKKLG